MPNRNRRKGDRAERLAVELLRDAGLDAYRVPLSGAVSGFKSDVEVRLGNKTLRFESKAKQAGFGLVYKYLGRNDGLIVKADRKESLVVLRLDDLANLLSSCCIQTEMLVDAPVVKTLAQPSSRNSSLHPIPIDPNIIYPDKPGW